MKYLETQEEFIGERHSEQDTEFLRKLTKYIQQLRMKNNLSLRTLAELSGKEEPSVHRYLVKSSNCSVVYLKRLVNGLGLTMAEFFQLIAE